MHGLIRNQARRALRGQWLAVVGAALFASQAFAFDPLAGDFTREDPRDIRVMAYNHHGDFIDNPSADAEFNRIFVAIDPDIICMEEFPSNITAGTIAFRLNSIMPIGGNGWQIHLGLLAGTRTVIASRFPLLLKRTDTIPASSTRGVTLALADLPDADYAVDVYLLGVHLKCCGNPGGSEDDSRQDSADAMANWMGDARGVSRPSGNNIVLPADTPMIALGDFNLVGGPQPEDTIVTGDIQSTGQYGSDVKGDWDNSNLTNLMPVDPFTGDTFTWQGSSSFPPSALDRMFYTDSVVTIANSFVLNTDTMSATALSVAGLQAGDTLPSNTSDHLPIVADLRLPAPPECTFDADCDDGDACNGAETCNVGTCALGTPLTCDDAIFCNGIESCDSGSGCVAGISPCGGGTWCDEGNTVCVPYGNGDFEPNGRVDLHDFAAFQECINAPGIGACAPANLVGSDATVDLADVAAFTGLLTGP
ncbi:MAG: hypothetical protein H6817_09540 [Phycisphaerales bacterium]|nr:hypothetical protein [Phycisphaerales bacterium]